MKKKRKYNKENKAAYDLVYRAENREKRLAQMRIWKQNNPAHSLWLNCRSRATKNGIEFTITKEDIVIPEFCPILGIKMQIGGNRWNSPSVDRINPSLGYTKGNIAVISYRANKIKTDATPQELSAIVDWLRKQDML